VKVIKELFSYINYLIDNDMLGNHGEKGITANGCYEDVLTIGKTYYCTGKMMGDTLIGVMIKEINIIFQKTYLSQ
jgi:hypothetical protein